MDFSTFDFIELFTTCLVRASDRKMGDTSDCQLLGMSQLPTVNWQNKSFSETGRKLSWTHLINH